MHLRAEHLNRIVLPYVFEAVLVFQHNEFDFLGLAAIDLYLEAE